MVETFHCVHFGQMVNLHEILFSKGAKGYMYSLVGMGRDIMESIQILHTLLV